MWQIYRIKTIITSRMSHVEMYISQKSKYKKILQSIILNIKQNFISTTDSWRKPSMKS